MSTTRRIIVNADDFGYSSELNAAILTSFQKGLISSTTVMANMPGFDEACALTTQYQLDGKVGVHLNLTEDEPLTEHIRQCSRFCGADGRFRLSGLKRPIFKLSRAEKDAVEEELKTQIQKVIDGGIHPTHFDSHHHVHTEWPIGTIVIRLAKWFGVPAVRLSANFVPNRSPLKRLYKRLYNARLKSRGLARTCYFGALADYPSMRAIGDVEAMVHPRPGRNGSVIDPDIKGDFAAFVKQLDIDSFLCSYAVYA